ncbi:MAG: hypothetical protein ABIG03_07730 [Candidatus Eisenbacteria bacterium]
MKTGRWFLFAAVSALVVALTGCAGDGPSAADRAGDLYLQGLFELYEGLADVDADDAPWEWDANVDSALSKFEEALEHDPDHCGALLGSALTRVLGVITDPELGEILRRLFPADRGAAPRSLFWFAAPPDVAGLARHFDEHRDDFHFSELQEYVESTALPSLGVADERLTRFEELGCQVGLVIVLPDAAGEKDQLVPVELDVADAYFAHAALDALESVAHLIASYDVDVDDGQSLQTLVETDPDFLTLRPGGHLQSTYGEIASVGLHLLDAADALEAETDEQSDDLITLRDGYVRLEELLGVGALETIRDLGEDIGDALDQGLSFELSDLEPGAPSVTVLVDLDELLNDPLGDLRDYLPAHTWPTPDSMRVTRPVTMPDPALGGVTPGMTDGDWAKIVEWLESGDPR